MGWLSRLFENINAVDRNTGKAPLHSAAQAGDVKRARELIECGANVHAVSSCGYTAEDLACDGPRARADLKSKVIAQLKKRSS
jgi:ankyrin repeat protein